MKRLDQLYRWIERVVEIDKQIRKLQRGQKTKRGRVKRLMKKLRIKKTKVPYGYKTAGYGVEIQQWTRITRSVLKIQRALKKLATIALKAVPNKNGLDWLRRKKLISQATYELLTHPEEVLVIRSKE